MTTATKTKAKPKPKTGRAMPKKSAKAKKIGTRTRDIPEGSEIRLGSGFVQIIRQSFRSRGDNSRRTAEFTVDVNLTADGRIIVGPRRDDRKLNPGTECRGLTFRNGQWETEWPGRGVGRIEGSGRARFVKGEVYLSE